MTVPQGDAPQCRVRRTLLAGALLLVLLGCLTPVGLAWNSQPAAQAALTTSARWGPWMQLYGRMHVVLVHFPIGLLIAAGIIEVFRAGRMGPRPGTATLVCLGLGWMAAAFAAYSGWTYAEMERHGHSPDGLIFWHRWGGVAVASAGSLTWLLGLLGRSGKRHWSRAGFFMILFVTTVLTGVVGHLGGSLVYGEDYLTEPFTKAERARHGWGEQQGAQTQRPDPSEQEAPPDGTDEPVPVVDRGRDTQTEPDQPKEDDSAANEDASGASGNPQAVAPPLTEDVAFQAVEPILDLSCTHCHGARKGKAGLRLHEIERLFEGDPVDWVVVPGHPEKSELMRRISLPLDHEDGMPSDDDPLPPDEIALIRTWIEVMDPVAHGLPVDGGNAGSAILGDWSQVTPSLPSDSANGTLDPDQNGAEESPGEGPAKATAESQQPEEESKPSDGAQLQSSSGTTAPDVEGALAVLRDRGAIANRVATDAEQVEVLFGLLRKDATDTDLSLLEGLEGVLVSLDLAQTSVSDAGLENLARFTHLERLHLEGTKVTDAGLAALGGMHSLEYLNLYGTKITDKGLLRLGGLTELAKLYLWQTGVSDEGVAALQKVLPELEIVRDLALPAPPPDLVVVEGDTTFDQSAGPILRAKCLDCHDGEDPAAGLVFASFKTMFQGPWAEWAVRPGEVDSSRLVRALRKEPGTKGAMPKKGERVTEEELEVLIAWVSGLREVEAQPEDE